MTIAPNPNQIKPYVPTVEDLSEALTSQYRYSELVTVLSHDDILSGFADAHDVQVSEVFSDLRDPEPLRIVDEETGEIISEEPKQRTPYDVDPGSVGLAHAAMARYSVVYGLAIQNPDWVLNSGPYFDLADRYLEEAGDTVGRKLNARRAAEAAALVGDEDMLEQYRGLADWTTERAEEEMLHYDSMREDLITIWDKMRSDAVSFKPDTPLKEDGSGSLYNAESRAYSRDVAVVWGVGAFAIGYNLETRAAATLYTSIEEPDLAAWQRIHHARILRMAGLSQEEIDAHPVMQEVIHEEQQAA